VVVVFRRAAAHGEQVGRTAVPGGKILGTQPGAVRGAPQEGVPVDQCRDPTPYAAMANTGQRKNLRNLRAVTNMSGRYPTAIGVPIPDAADQPISRLRTMFSPEQRNSSSSTRQGPIASWPLPTSSQIAARCSGLTSR